MTNLFDPSLGAAAQAAPVPVAPAATLFTGLGDDAWRDASKALALDYDVTVPGLARPFHPWQAAAYVYANDSIARWGGVIIGDDMGLGKTAVILALAADAVRTTGRPAIIVAPPVVEGGYINELHACFPHLRLQVVKGHKRRPLDPADIYLLSDDSRTMQTWLTDVGTNPATGKRVHTASAWVQGASLVAQDEIHRSKGNGGKPTGRARAMLAVGEYCRAVGTPIVGATGTLLSNRPVEAYLPLQIVGGERIIKALTPGAHSITGYLWRYCAPTQGTARGGRKFTSFGGIDTTVALTLHDHLRRTFYVRREKSDLGEGVLPHSGWVVAPMALPDGTMRRYQRVEHDFYQLCTEERGAVWADKVSRAQAVVQMGMLREEAGVAKAEAAADYIADLVLEEGKQVVAFYDHKRVWEKLALALLGKGVTVTTINGQVTGDDRIEAVAEFQRGDAQVVLAQIKAAGIGVTLTAAADAVFVQCGWAAGDLKQCADRILRADDISRARAAAGERVTWHVLQAHYADGDATFDAHIWDVLEKKAAVCDAVNAGRPVTMDEDSVQKEALLTWQPSQRHYKGGW
jgi:SWI/SNF-related matrix-associated actin-dependent regulator 1 of chromatin subfamily A